LVAACAVALFAVACGGGGGQAGQGSGEGTGGEESLKGTQVAMIPHFRGPYTEQIVEGSRAAADSAGAKFQTAGPTGIDPPGQIQDFRDVVAAGAKAVTVVAYPEDQWIRPIDDAAASGVPVSTTDVASPKSKETIHVGPRQQDLGKTLGEVVARKLGKDARGEVVLGLCIPGLDVLEARTDAFKKVFAEQAPNVKVLGPFDVSDDPSENFSNWQRLVQTNEDALAFVGVCEFDLPSLVRIKDKDPGADYEIASIGINPEGLQGIESGTALAAVGQKPFFQGYVAMKFLLDQMAKGNTTPEEMPRGWIDSGAEVVTADNVKEIIAREESLDEGYQKTLDYYKKDMDKILADPKAYIRPFDEYISGG
jgi:ribose transport system substrate-binding protein